MIEDKFTKWYSWENRNDAKGNKYPGVYIIAMSKNNIMSKAFNWLPTIIYIGMTNSISGLKGRLKQFDNTIIGKTGHGGADRVRYKYQNYNVLINKLYVSMSHFECNVKSNNPIDLRVMGEVTKFEYDCLAHYVDLFCCLPEFNNKKLSPKYSLTIGRNNVK